MGWQSVISQGKIPWNSVVAGNWTRATGRTDSELCHWAIMTWLWPVSLIWFWLDWQAPNPCHFTENLSFINNVLVHFSTDVQVLIASQSKGRKSPLIGQSKKSVSLLSVPNGMNAKIGLTARWKRKGDPPTDGIDRGIPIDSEEIETATGRKGSEMMTGGDVTGRKSQWMTQSSLTENQTKVSNR